VLGGINNSLFIFSFSGFFALAILIILLRWAFSRGSSLIERPSRSGNDDEYGLLTVVASPTNHIEGEMVRQKLLAHGIKANLTQTNSGPKVMVFATEVRAAEAILRS